MRVLLLYKKETEKLDELTLLFSKINVGLDTFAISSGGEGEILPALCRRLRGKDPGELTAIAPTHLVFFPPEGGPEFSSHVFAFLAGFGCGAGLPVAVYGEGAAASIPAHYAFAFKALNDKKSLVRYLKHEWEKEKKQGLRRETGAARDVLLQMGISVTKESLVRCVREGAVRELVLFLAAGFSPDTRDEAGVALLHHAARTGNQEMLQTLVEAGAQVNFLAEDRGSSALLDAVMIRRPDMARILMDAGADVNLTSKDGQSALIIAAGAGDPSCVEMLLKAGADPDEPDALGASARKYAALFHNRDIQSLFDTYAPSKAG
jgi:hypothetical protein